MNLLRISTAAFAFTALSSCASAPAVERASSNNPVSVAAASDGPVTWRAQLQPTQQRTGRAAPTARQKSTGSITLTQTAPGRTRVRLMISTPTGFSTALQWAILPGRCGSGTMPIDLISRFPVVEVSNDGRGELDMPMQLDLPVSGTYHVNVYSGGTQLNHVITCGNLSRV